MIVRTKAAMLKVHRANLDLRARLAKTRDNLRGLRDELETQLKASEEATDLLEECIDKLSELN